MQKDEKTQNVSIIVVTYNRFEMLLNCLESIFSQTFDFSSLIIVDNNSTDSTPKILYEKSYINHPETSSKRYKNKMIYYERLASNEGGASGFCHGLKKAMQLKSEWFWLMDDDVKCTKSALTSLLNYSHLSKCIHPSKEIYDGSKVQWEGWFNTKTASTKWYGDKSFYAGEKYCSVNYGCFEGMLIHRSIVEKIGYPDKRFFLVGDDLIYGWLASQHTKALYIQEVCLIKQRKAEEHKKILGREMRDLSQLTSYLNLRNHFLLVEYLNKYGYSSFSLRVSALLKLIKHLIKAFFIDCSFLQAKLLIKGYKDGRNSRFGVPQI